MPLDPKLASLGHPPKVLLIGSGGLSIGQAGEFDYCGTQAIKALLEEGVQVVVVNPNIATVQTDIREGCQVYLYPIEPEWVERIIEMERPDAIIAGFGGQTALNCVLKLDEQGVLARFNVKNLGTPPEVLRLTEDRGLFSDKLKQIGLPVPKGRSVSSVKEAMTAAKKLRFPVIVRAAFALGGMGSGICRTPKELKAKVTEALQISPSVAIEKSLEGWKEIEYEVLRDSTGNAIAICNMENFDPLGIHTGDSIVVVPSQTLTDEEFQLLRTAALTLVKALGVVGECNVQFALHPKSLEFVVIEVNARLSRSSALASKASGYPIAYIAAKVVLGYGLLELKNPVTQVTSAFFEPALDYVTVKMPRWDLRKFKDASFHIGSAMKSVGEVMAIGRSFPEALQKAVRMVMERGSGLSASVCEKGITQIKKSLREPTDTRLFSIVEGFRKGMTVQEIHQLTFIDKWFLTEIHQIVRIEKEISRVCRRKNAMQTIDRVTWRQWKRAGFGDEQIALVTLRTKASQKGLRFQEEVQRLSESIRKARIAKNVRPVVKKIDTTAAEYPSPSNYLYVTYGGEEHDDDIFSNRNNKRCAITLGSGAYRVGTSVEFDWCAVSCSEQLRESGWTSILINCNPETVSTDFNCSDRLYFEELTLERVLDIVELERPNGVITCMGGQHSNQLAGALAKCGVELLGHSANAIRQSEDRGSFSAMLDRLGIEQPQWCAASSFDEIEQFIQGVGFPVVVRPSYVLSGTAMKLAYDEKTLAQALSTALAISSEYPVVFSQFEEGAREVEFDGVARNGKLLFGVISEHLENAGIHSGDATIVIPPVRISQETLKKIEQTAGIIAQELKLNGPVNIQFLSTRAQLLVIECNARVSRTFPFASKVVGIHLAREAVKTILGLDATASPSQNEPLSYYGIKSAVFSFQRLGGVDPILGIEMASTGEVGCIDTKFEQALLLSSEAAGIKPPKKGVLVSSGTPKDKFAFLTVAAILKDLNIPIFATAGTAQYLREHGYEPVQVPWPGSGKGDALDILIERHADLVVNIPKNWSADELSKGASIRRQAIKSGCSIFTNMQKTVAYFQALSQNAKAKSPTQVRSLSDWQQLLKNRKLAA